MPPARYRQGTRHGMSGPHDVRNGICRIAPASRTDDVKSPWTAAGQIRHFDKVRFSEPVHVARPGIRILSRQNGFFMRSLREEKCAD